MGWSETHWLDEMFQAQDCIAEFSTHTHYHFIYLALRPWLWCKLFWWNSLLYMCMSPNQSSKQDWVASCHCFGQWSTVALFLFHCSQVLSKWKKPEGSLGFPDHTVSYLIDGLEQPQAPDEEWWLEHLEIQCWDERNIKFKVNFSGLY